MNLSMVMHENYKVLKFCNVKNTIRYAVSDKVKNCKMFHTLAFQKVKFI